MHKLGLVLLLMATIGAFGCGRKSAKSSTTPLTVQEWQGLPAQEKFSHQTMERLKLGDPKFQDDSQWDYFAHTVFLPAQAQELPNGPRKK